MSDSIVLRAALATEAERLTEIALRAKAHWGYPAEWLELWRPSLTFTAETMSRQWVQVAAAGGNPVAVAAVDGAAATPELAHLWVEPTAMGLGLGRRLFTAAADHARARGATALEVVSDPNAEAFYLRLGARRVGDVSSEPGGRRLPLLSFRL